MTNPGLPPTGQVYPPINTGFQIDAPETIGEERQRAEDAVVPPDIGIMLGSPLTRELFTTVEQLTQNMKAYIIERGELTATIEGLKAALVASREEVEELRIKLAEEKNIADEIIKIAHMDSLTGVGNRRKWDDEVEPELKKLMEDGIPEGDDVILAFLDVDNFKEVNLKYGHPGGDKILQNLVLRVNEILIRIQGKVSFCRYGGDEFVCAIRLSGYEEEGIAYLVNIIQDLLGNINNPESCNEELGFGISAGSARLKDYILWGEAVKAANKKMFENKKLRLGDRRKRY